MEFGKTIQFFIPNSGDLETHRTCTCFWIIDDVNDVNNDKTKTLLGERCHFCKCSTNSNHSSSKSKSKSKNKIDL